MRRFLGEALTHCKMYDASRVLQCLGSPETAGSQRLIEICHFPHSVSVSGLQYVLALTCLSGHV